MLPTTEMGTFLGLFRRRETNILFSQKPQQLAAPLHCNLISLWKGEREGGREGGREGTGKRTNEDPALILAFTEHWLKLRFVHRTQLNMLANNITMSLERLRNKHDIRQVANKKLQILNGE